MRFTREGLVLLGVGVTIASMAMAFALYRRSWPLWLFAAALMVVALWVAYASRQSASQRVTSGADGSLVLVAARSRGAPTRTAPGVPRAIHRMHALAQIPVAGGRRHS